MADSQVLKQRGSERYIGKYLRRQISTAQYDMRGNRFIDSFIYFCISSLLELAQIASRIKVTFVQGGKKGKKKTCSQQDESMVEISVS